MKKALLVSLLFVSLRLVGQDSMYNDNVSPRAKKADQVRTPAVPVDAFSKGSQQLSSGLLMVGLGAAVSFFAPLALDNSSKNTKQYQDNMKVIGYVGGGLMTLGGFIGASGAIKLGKAHRQAAQ